MSFLRKRSRSQSSGSESYDNSGALPSDRKDSNETSIVERRYSGVSEISTRPVDHGWSDSCVVRNSPKHKSSHLRFLAWVAYTRKYDNTTITDVERRTCPLLWCREVFADQEAMLQHVWECEHLSKGLYWCFHCQKPERVGRFQCKRCQGLPSKTDRLATVAKKIFSKLGTKHHREDTLTTISDSWSPSNRYLPEIPESDRPDQLLEIQDEFEPEEFPPYEPLPELPNNYISEMENTSVIPEIDSNWNVNPKELQKPHQPEKASSNYGTGLYASMVLDPADHTFSESNPPWSPSSFEPGSSDRRSSGRSLPVLALNTRDIYQPPSSRHRLGRTGTFYDEPLSATIISPLSATDGFFSGMLGLSGYEVSPTGSETGCDSLPSDSGYGSAPITSATTTSMDFDRIWDFHISNNESSNGKGKTLGLMKPPSKPAKATSSTIPSRSSSNSSNHSANRCTAPTKPGHLSAHWSDSKTLVKAFIDVLAEHLQHSRNALNKLPCNSTIRELLAMSSSSIISVGFNALRGLLENRSPTAIIEIFAFSHVAYAAAIAVDDTSSTVRSDEWFQDSLCWLSGLSSERQRLSYTLIVQAIWKPQELTEMENFLDSSRLTELVQPPLEHDNRLVKACKHFLDIQENLCNSESGSQPSINTISLFNFSQASFYRLTKNRVIDELIQKVSIEAFIEDVVTIEQRLQDGAIKNVRQLELELICAGKLATQSSATYNRFVSHVTCLCDTLYAEGESEKSRIQYQIEDIDVTKSLIPEEASGDEDVDADFVFSDLLEKQSDLVELHPSDHSLENFLHEVDSVFNDSAFRNSLTEGHGQSDDTQLSSMDASKTKFLSHSTNLSRSHSDPVPSTKHIRQSRPHDVSSFVASTDIPHPSTTSVLFSASKSAAPSSAPTPAVSSSSASEKDKYKCHCGYVPQGEEKWKPSNLARHKRTQHPVEAKIYKCRFPGCASTFTRSDNLRSHARDKGHDVGGSTRDRNGAEEISDLADGDRRTESRHRPSKRRKVIADIRDDATGSKVGELLRAQNTS